MMAKLPLPIEGDYHVTLEYGQIKGYTLNGGFHKGIDIVSANRRLVLPVEADVQALPSNGNDGNAMYITSRHEGYQLRVAICHMANFAIPSGHYKAGTYLGQMGMTGAADGVHAHIAVRVDGILTDPRTTFNIKEDDMYKGYSAEQLYKMWQDADLFKQAVVKSKAWVGDMNQRVEKVEPIISDTYQYKADALKKAQEISKDAEFGRRVREMARENV